MENMVREYIASMSTEDKLQIIDDYNQFEKDGFVGDCLLRVTATSLTVNRNSIIVWMNVVVQECWRSFCMERVDQINKGQT